MAVVDVFDTGLFTQFGAPEPVFEFSLLAFGPFPVHHESEALFKSQFVLFDLIHVILESGREAIEFHVDQLLICLFIEHGLFLFNGSTRAHGDFHGRRRKSRLRSQATEAAVYPIRF